MIFILARLFAPQLVVPSALSQEGEEPSTLSKYRKVLSSFPLFIVVFFLIILLNTFVSIPAQIVVPLATGKGEPLSLNVASTLLTTAIIGICFRVRRDVVGKSGWRILAVGGIAWGLQSFLVFWLAHSLPIPNV